MTKPERPIDWRQVCDDLAWLLADEPGPGEDRVPLGTKRLACQLGFSRGAIRNLRDGSRPRYEDGVRLIARWTSLTGKHPDYVPRA